MAIHRALDLLFGGLFASKSRVEGSEVPCCKHDSKAMLVGTVQGLKAFYGEIYRSSKTLQILSGYSWLVLASLVTMSSRLASGSCWKSYHFKIQSNTPEEHL